MRKIRLGRSGIVSPQNGFGALPVQRVGTEDAVKLLRAAYDAGFTYFDTARAYSDSEEKLGLAFSDVRDSITIATKTMATGSDGLWRDLETSLKKLRTDYIDIYQLHNPPYCPEPGDEAGLYDAMLKAKEQGLIRHIGITNHRAAVAEKAIRSGLYETLQYPFSYLSSEVDERIVRLCEEFDVGFIAMKALSGGLLTRADAAMAWIMRFPDVLPIWGIQHRWELDQFASFMDAPPEYGGALAAYIEEDRKTLSGDFCRACGYCMPCPQEINIFDCARMSQLIRRSPSAGWLTPKSQEMMMKIKDCIGCGSCASKCPYGLDTPALLRKNLEDYENILAGKVKV